MPEAQLPTVVSTRPGTLDLRAVSHGPRGLLIAAVLGVAWSGAACDRPLAGGTSESGAESAATNAEESGAAAELAQLQAAEARAPATGNEARELEQLAEAFVDYDPTLTSDHYDAWIVHQREVQERLREGGPALGLAALEVFQETLDEPGGRLNAFLDIAAHCAPASTAPVLEALIVTYHGGQLLGARTEAVRLLAETSPARAREFLEPLVLDERPNNTRPSQEALMEGWILAARALGIDAARVPAEVATNLFQPPEARYVAIKFLGESGTPLAKTALRELFVEATSDGLIRRKAAQAMVECMPAHEVCPIVIQVSEHESDPHFLNFLGDLIERNCGG